MQTLKLAGFAERERATYRVQLTVSKRPGTAKLPRAGTTNKEYWFCMDFIRYSWPCTGVLETECI